MLNLTTQFHLRISDSGIASYNVERLDERGRAIASHGFAAPDAFAEIREARPSLLMQPLSRAGEAGAKILEYGRILFECAFQTGILAEWRALREKGEQIHLVVEPGSPELDALPWEYLADGGEPLLADAAISLSRRHAAARPRPFSTPPPSFSIRGAAARESDAKFYGDIISRAHPSLEGLTGAMEAAGANLADACRRIAESNAAVALLVGVRDDAPVRAISRSKDLRILILVPDSVGEPLGAAQERMIETIPLEEKVSAVAALPRPAADGALAAFLSALIEAMGRGLAASVAMGEARRHCLQISPDDLTALGVRLRLGSDAAAVDLEAVRQSRLRQKTKAIISFKKTEDPHLRALKLGQFANMLRDSGEIDRAIETYGDTAAAFREAGDPYNEAVALNQKGTLLVYRGRHGEAVAPLDEAAAIRLKMGTLPEAEMTLSRLGYAAAALGELEKAERYYRQAADIDRSLMRREPLATVLLRLGGVYKRREKNKEAEETLRECIALARDISNPAAILVDAYSYLGAVLMAEKRFEEAEEIYRKCTELADLVGNHEEIALAQNNLGNILQRRGDFVEACGAYKKGLDIFAALKQDTGVASSLHNLAVVNEKLGNAGEAVEAAYLAREISSRIGNTTLKDVISRQLERMRSAFGPERFRKAYNAAMDKTRKIQTEE